MANSWALAKETLDWIETNIPTGSRVLEFGSGSGTEWLSEKFQLTSVEHDSNYVGRYNSQYIHAPLVNGWYDPLSLEQIRGTQWDLIIVDGPPGHLGHGREPLLLYFRELGLQCGCPVVVDDTHRAAEKLIVNYLLMLGYQRETIQCRSSQKTSDILMPQKIAPRHPQLAFLIPVKAAVHSWNYTKEYEILEDTINQALQIPNSVAVVVANDHSPASQALRDNARVILSTSNDPIPSSIKHYASRATDKVRKRLQAFNEINSDYYMMLDADDYVPLGLGQVLEQERPQHGIYMPDACVIYDDGAYCIQNPNDPDTNWATLCGSSLVFSNHALKKLLEDVDRWRLILSTHGDTPGAAIKAGLPLTERRDLLPGYKKTGYNVSQHEFWPFLRHRRFGDKYLQLKSLDEIKSIYFES